MIMIHPLSKSAPYLFSLSDSSDYKSDDIWGDDSDSREDDNWWLSGRLAIALATVALAILTVWS
jgi:hypothetical protein